MRKGILGCLLFILTVGAVFASRQTTTSCAVPANRINFGSAASLDNLLTFTICAWVYPVNWTTYQHILAKEQGAPFTDQATFIHLDNAHSGGLECGIRYGGGFGEANTALADGTLSANTWYHIAITFDNSGDKKVRIYVNAVEGSYDHQTAGTGSKNDDSGADLTAFEGAVSGSQYCGYMHDLTIWKNKVLTTAEMAYHKAGGNPYPEKQVLHALMIRNGSQSEPDLSGTGNNGTASSSGSTTQKVPGGWSLDFRR
jgi:hypothetical protein